MSCDLIFYISSVCPAGFRGAVGETGDEGTEGLSFDGSPGKPNEIKSPLENVCFIKNLDWLYLGTNVKEELYAKAPNHNLRFKTYHLPELLDALRLQTSLQR